MTSGPIPVPKRTLIPPQYDDLADVPPEVEWLANITIQKPAALTRSTFRNLGLHRPDRTPHKYVRHARPCHRLAQGDTHMCDCRAMPIRHHRQRLLEYRCYFGTQRSRF